MSKLLEDVAVDGATVTEVSSSRFSVPELFERDTAPTIETDIWQFASSVLHCFSNEVPCVLQTLLSSRPWCPTTHVLDFFFLCRYHDIKRNGQVVRELMDGKHPNRPMNTDLAVKWITDDIWGMLVKCWAFNPAQRQSMADTRQEMIRIERAMERKRTQTLTTAGPKLDCNFWSWPAIEKRNADRKKRDQIAV
jgi:hypothetical protein